MSEAETLTPTPSPATEADLANAIRVLAMDAVEAATCGHPGMPMGMADVATALFARHLKFDPTDPTWADRDRFVLSNGHGSMLLYALLHLTGYPGMTMEEIKRFRQWGSLTPGHPEYRHTPGVETTTGPLGQGISTAVGMAMAERHLNARFGDVLVDHRTWVMCGDGDLMEGVSQEAISLAGRLKLNRLTVLWDDNDITIDGALSLSETGDQLARFRAAGWMTRRIDGHNTAQIDRALRWATRQPKPVLIACKTKIGRGSATLEGHHDTHGKALGKAEIAATREKLGWPHAPFVMPESIAEAWARIGKRGATVRKRWGARLFNSPLKAEFERAMAGELPAEAFARLDAHIAKLIEAPPALATRAASGAALEALVPANPDLVGGSADLTGSNNTLVKGMAILDAPDYGGTYVNYGIREHAMGAAMNGMALHGGVIPYGGTFLVFTDYSRPAIRLAALMGIRVIHVGTHDSIGVGEDGPTHQPVEHLAALRAIPNLNVFRPGDAVEAAECWRVALESETTPSVMALSRQKTAACRITSSTENLSARGAYEIRPAVGEAKATLFATGTELALALTARDTLQAEGVPTRVVSVPCWRLFEVQDQAYRDAVLGKTSVRVAVEAGVRMGWDRYVGQDGGFVGMTGFGASAPAERLYREFGITAEAVVAQVKARL
ncbi:transketolase [Caulobacter sp. S45]|uniref:transketolase n=1 Tax=Caulobacter sp. S45 TaxID=1641861 RepID=UPI00131B9FF4|nr:transketolase [Caulobacter sp. S45]